MESNPAPELSAAAALASTAAARDAIARRVETPWPWDALPAASIGAFMAVIPYVTGSWTAIVIALWVVAFLLINGARVRRAGVVADGGTRRTFDPVHIWAWMAALGVYAAGLALASRTWDGLPVLTAAVAAVIVFAGLRWVNRRAVARIRNQP